MLTGRHKLLRGLDETEQDRLIQQDKPDWITPTSATLVRQSFSDPDWLFEPKLDGVRCLAHCRDGYVALYTRNKVRLDQTYPELAAALSEQAGKNYIVDGEVVALRGPLSSFSRLQGRASDTSVYYYLFDLLYYDGYRLTALPLRTRKQLLMAAFRFSDPLRYTPHHNTEGRAYHRDACRKGWEGVIAKCATAAYPGKRSRLWLKLKCFHQQEFVIAGYTEPKGQRKGFGALLVGYYDDQGLRYAGRIGTGFDQQQLQQLHDTLAGMERRTSAFVDEDIATSGVHWAQPELVAEVAFTEWTDEGRLRHPSFLGLRVDKQPHDVVREQP